MWVGEGGEGRGGEVWGLDDEVAEGGAEVERLEDGVGVAAGARARVYGWTGERAGGGKRVGSARTAQSVMGGCTVSTQTGHAEGRSTHHVLPNCSATGGVCERV